MNLNVYLRSVLFFATALFFLSSCSDQLDEVQPNESLNAALEQNASDNSMTTTSVTFTATAMIASCHGENIRFTGIIENRVKRSVSASGQDHYFRQFTVRGMVGTGLTTGIIYDVVGGAEMFSIKNPVFVNGSLSLPASITESDILIHRGTLVFVSKTDGSRVVARHIITKNPGKGVMENTWDCGGN
ncbi:hypothetical protein [Pontibacter cellulosilyticus]|uniref:Lipoprotein n=1 Tax=Pontibacter cellulosilyticus TaxID=1720253 RepID=A0A923SK38_9BACT|nr:hypothetical protein [Pontibacter cellulosilyticus]MBC5994539.1 hypothetical protein [Pontibacter cellulosilyticus]